MGSHKGSHPLAKLLGPVDAQGALPVHPKRRVCALVPRPRSVTLFGKRDFADVIKLRVMTKRGIYG